MPDLYRLFWPFLQALDPETAHRLSLGAMRTGLAAALFADRYEHECLKIEVWGRAFANPIGLAAGFDKNAEVLGATLQFGFGFIEVGGVTPQPQPGNPKPRLFRLTDDQAVINRFGFNSDGIAVVASRLAAWRKAGGRSIVGVNLGKNKTSEDAIADYVSGVDAFAPLADFLVINLSSPNTPGLRALQSIEPLVAIIRAARAKRDEKTTRPPLLLKIAPDLIEEEVADICRAAVDAHVDGLVVSNTTIARPHSLRSPHRNETGGLSGKPLFETSTRMLRDVYRLTDGGLPLVGVGGISSGADAYAKIRAGASLIQIYSALVYHGPALIGRIKRDLVALLARDGFTTVAQAVGADHRPFS